ncbi:MAG: hypothetical protein HEQ32_03705 [Vampirovibrio sp.]
MTLSGLPSAKVSWNTVSSSSSSTKTEASETDTPKKQTPSNLSPKTTAPDTPSDATLGSSIFEKLVGKQSSSANTALQTFNQLPLPSISPIPDPVLPNANTSLTSLFMPQTVGQANQAIQNNINRNLVSGKLLITDTVPLVPTNNATPAGVTLTNFNAAPPPGLA